MFILYRGEAICFHARTIYLPVQCRWWLANKNRMESITIINKFVSGIPLWRINVTIALWAPKPNDDG